MYITHFIIMLSYVYTYALFSYLGFLIVYSSMCDGEKLKQ